MAVDTGEVLTDEEHAELRPLFDKAMNTPVIAPLGLGSPSFAETAWERVYQALDAIAVDHHGLPALDEGHYGLAEGLQIVAPEPEAAP